MYAPQNAEEKMEKYRFYCELPGDFWEARCAPARMAPSPACLRLSRAQPPGDNTCHRTAEPMHPGTVARPSGCSLCSIAVKVDNILSLKFSHQ